MGFGWTRGLALPLLLLTLLTACQSGPYQRNYARTAGYGYAPGYGACSYNPCKPRRVCPPGHILARIPYTYGGPGRYCKPHYRRCCAPPPPPCGWQGPRPCQHSRARPYAAY